MPLGRDPAQLKQFVCEKLAPITDADPSVLADYVIALVSKEDKPERQLVENCVQSLEDFLRDGKPR